MKKKYLTLIFIILTLNSCQTRHLIYQSESKLKKTLNFILTTVVNSDLKKFPFEPDKSKLILYVTVENYKDLFRESTLIFDIQLWNKQYFDVKTNYEFNGIKIYFGSTKQKYINLFSISEEKSDFNTKKITPNSHKKKKNKKEQTIKLSKKLSITDPLTWTNIYFNSKTEVTYIDREQYISILNKEIDFDKKYFK